MTPMDQNFAWAQLTSSTMAVWVIDWLKASNWFPFINQNTWRVNRAAGIIAAALTAAGIHLALASGTVEGTYTITVTGLTGAAAWEFAKGFAISMASQETILNMRQAIKSMKSLNQKVPNGAPISGAVPLAGSKP